MTKLTIIAAIAPGGVIGRTSKPCLHVPEPGREPSSAEEFSRVADAIGCCPYCGGFGTVACNDMPWHYAEDLARFKALTMGHAVIMGRRTWESLPPKHRPLAGRANVVLSHDWCNPPEAPGVYRALSLAGALAMVRDYEEDDNAKAFVLGGAQLFAEALPLATTLELTLIARAYEGDVVFPHGAWFADPAVRVVNVDAGQFECVSRTPGEHPDLTFTTWRKSR